MATAKKTKSDLVKVEATVHNLSGKYLLPYNKGQKFEIEAKQAKEMIEAKDVKEVNVSKKPASDDPGKEDKTKKEPEGNKEVK